MVLLTWLVKKVLMGRLKRWANKMNTSPDDQLVGLLDRALSPGLAVGIFAAAANILPLSQRFLRVLNRGAYFGVLAVVLCYGSKVLQILLSHWLARQSAHAERREPIRFVSRVTFGGRPFWCSIIWASR